ncbi:DUF4102 domain-containing protein [Paraburkholderia sp. Cy-641]|uniref:Arm DNA-binding domain-containing protein n=1 Tax=Paraburkholderia sp. Cy-641 TaxID=2608337 RepID=UPI00141E1CFC|nr:Arm DNA-binding domain-containing protein [Paraburkholderia sp. Cy-641]NIF80284.1 DUF4102 domain-containing protein [Paraburkholderia sp. Cy-641]
MRTINRLTAATIKRLISNSPKKARYYLDGDGLNIQITPTGVASWVLKYQLHNRSRELGLGRWLRAPWQASGARIGTLPALRGLFSVCCAHTIVEPGRSLSEAKTAARAVRRCDELLKNVPPGVGGRQKTTDAADSSFSRKKAARGHRCIR